MARRADRLRQRQGPLVQRLQLRIGEMYTDAGTERPGPIDIAIQQQGGAGTM